MHPKLAACALVVLLAGCQARNPYAAFGPATIPAPGMQTPAPYYAAAAPKSSPANASSAATIIPPLTEPAADAYDTAVSRFVADASDGQPIRIVENPAAIRTATAPASASPSPNTGPQAPPGSTPPAAAPPALNRLRGFIPASPAGGSDGRPGTPLDPRVVPAAYQQPGTFAEQPAAAGQWKAR